MNAPAKQAAIGNLTTLYNNSLKMQSDVSGLELGTLLAPEAGLVALVKPQFEAGRAALLHLGAFTATIMSANVFMIIMPNQRIVVADLKAGRTPDPKYGKKIGRASCRERVSSPV